MSGRQSQLTALRAVNSDLYRQLNELRAAKDADLKRITHERDVLCEIRDMSYREIAALKADKERLREADTRMRKALIDIEDDAHAKAVAGLPLNVHSTLMSARYGLGIDSELLSPADDTYDSGKFGAPDNLDRPEFPLNNLLEEPPADGQPCQEFTYMLDSPGLPAECSCFYTYDGKLAKQCDNCRNKPFAPADGGEQWIGDMSNESFDKWLRILKKMGELTVREDGGTPFKIKSVDGLYTGADCVNDTLNDVIDWVSRHGGLEFLVPTYEGVKSICTKCEAPIEACECEFEDDYEANSHTRRSPADGDGVEETSAGGNMENPSFLIGAKCDDGEPVSLHIHHGNNGDFYPEIRYKDKKDGNWRRSPSPRISTSGGHNGPEILIAIANLYRALAGRGIEG